MATCMLPHQSCSWLILHYTATTPPGSLPCRVQAGHCFHVFSKFRHSKMEEFQLPEMLRTPLEELVLQIKILKLGRVIPFLQKALEPPKEKSVRNALQCLQELVSCLPACLFTCLQ